MPFIFGLPGLGAQVPQKPNRIVVLAPSLAEIIEDLGVAERIVGVADSTQGLAGVPRVGGITRISLERVVALKPELVLGTQDGNSKDQVNHLRELGIPVAVVATRTFTDIAQSVSTVANAIGEPSAGEKLAEKFRAGLEIIRLRTRKTGRRVLLQLGQSPIVVAGGASFLGEALRLVGAENVYENAQRPYPRPSLEDILSKNPERILVLGMTLNEANQVWKGTPGIQGRELRFVHSDQLMRPSVRILEELAWLRQAVWD